MGKLAPARVSYRDDFLISYRVYRLMSHFISLLYELHFMLIKYKSKPKLQTLCMRYLFQSTGRPISHQNKWSLRVHNIPLRNFILLLWYNNLGKLTLEWLASA